MKVDSNIVLQATLNDLEQLSILFNDYRVFYKQDSDIDGARNFLFERFAHSESVIFMARDSQTGEAVGFTQLYPVFSSVSMKRSWILNDLYVNESSRGKGIARQLLNAARDYAKQTNAKGLELSTAKDNVTAQRLYEQLGYEKDEDFYHYYLTL